jgi:hypothetical protein
MHDALMAAKEENIVMYQDIFTDKLKDLQVCTYVACP